jgi:DNA polymerase
MDNYVGGYGCSSAKLLICGEAPGGHEVETGVPFSGPSGGLLNQALEYGGTSRDACYATNVVKVRPPNNRIEDLKLIGHSIEEFLPQLYEEIETMKPNCILAVGNTALTALTGLKGIQNYRGSILQYSRTGCKVVPCLHPASLLHESGGEMLSWKEFAFIKADVKRAYEQSLFPEYNIPQRYLGVARNSQEVYRFLNRYQKNEMVSLDVETYKTYAQCVGLAFNSYEALSIPTFVDTIPMTDMVHIWKMLAEFLADTKIKIIAQNAKFDQKRCRQIGLTWHDCYFSMDMGWHVLFPEFPKKLQLISSLITEEPYYKDEGKEVDPKNIDKWFRYNGKDAAVEYECADKILQELKDSKLSDFFWDKINPLYKIYYDMEDVGLLVDQKVRDHLRGKYKQMHEDCHARLVANICKDDPDLYDAWKDFNVMSNGPKNQVAKLIFGVLKCPIRKDTADDTLKALANNAVKDQRRKDIIFGVLDDRKLRKTVGTYINAGLSPHGRIHTQCNINGAESGRTSTGILKPPVAIEKSGIALQTMTKHEDVNLNAGGGDLRAMFIADPDFTLVEPDLSQAEDRVVCVLAEDWDALKDYDRKVFKKNQHGLKDDRHTTTAMFVCEMGFDAITDWERQIGKKTRHAGNYNVGKHQHMLTLGKLGIFISEFKAGKQLDAFHASNPKIRGVYHEGIVEALRDYECVLYNPFGRRRIFYNKWGEDLFKEAYAQIPQSTITDQTKFAMTRLRNRFPKEYLRDFFFTEESHDSFLALVRDSFLVEFCAASKEELERPINFKTCSLPRDYDLIIPCEIQYGKRWIKKSSEYPDGMRKYELD